jgi:hypothetical protein
MFITLIGNRLSPKGGWLVTLKISHCVFFNISAQLSFCVQQVAEVVSTASTSDQTLPRFKAFAAGCHIICSYSRHYRCLVFACSSLQHVPSEASAAFAASAAAHMSGSKSMHDDGFHQGVHISVVAMILLSIVFFLIVQN